MSTLSAIILTRNEAHHIQAALESVAWADHRLVFDSGSSDATVARRRQAVQRCSITLLRTTAQQRNARP
ncbi:MAG: hypothetical protein HC915_15695 [Anaerolineae bacterium]|nr:hypothetical protein [Anaerolineae bacterium]